MAKTTEKIKARKLRNQGESIKVIARDLNVSPSSVSKWCKDIKLTLSQIKELERRSRDPYYGRRLENSLLQKRRSLEKTELLKKQGIEEIDNLTKRELFLVGVALYWAEGFKKDSQAGFASSDPDMIKIFLKWLIQCCGYTISDLSFRVTANFSHAQRIREIQSYWSEVVGVNNEQFQKPFFQRVRWKKVYENPNEYFGVLRVKVRKSTDFLRKIAGWIEGLKIQD